MTTRLRHEACWCLVGSYLALITSLMTTITNPQIVVVEAASFARLASVDFSSGISKPVSLSVGGISVPFWMNTELSLSSDGFRSQLSDFMRKADNDNSDAPKNTAISPSSQTYQTGSLRPLNGTGNGNGNQNQYNQASFANGFFSGNQQQHWADMTTKASLQSQSPTRADEYDVVFPGESCFYFLETEGGETAFGGYKPLPDGSKSPAELCNLVRNIGDVFVAVDGVSTYGKKYDQVWTMLKATENNAYCCYRFRDIKHAHVLRVPSERKKEELQADLHELQRQVNVKKSRVEQIQKESQILQGEILDISKQMEQKKEELRQLEVQDIQWMEQRLEEMKSKVQQQPKT